MTGEHGAPTVAIIAGEASGDHLGGPLMAAIKGRSGGPVRFLGVGGTDMVEQGLNTLFPMSDIAIMGPIAIARRLPSLLRRIRETADAIVAAEPDLLVIIDCPEFSHRVARRVRARLPGLPIVDYVAPTVWAWRPGRARAMLAYVDHVMALLPFEPEAFKRLGGPPCTYVGHPATERPLPDGAAIEQLRADRCRPDQPLLAVMPGSRHNEIKRLIGPFAEAVERLHADHGLEPALAVPTLPHLEDHLRSITGDWRTQPTIVTTPESRRLVMTAADAALVASGTATLELALTRTPMVVGYRMERLFAWLRPFFPVHSIVLPNLIHGGNPIPEFFQRQCTGPALADALAQLLRDGPARRDQLLALDEIIAKLKDDEAAPSVRAAEVAMATIARTPGDAPVAGGS